MPRVMPRVISVTRQVRHVSLHLMVASFVSLSRRKISAINKSCHIYECVMSPMNESCHTYELVMAHIWMSHGTHMNESCHIYECVMSPMNKSCYQGLHVLLEAYLVERQHRWDMSPSWGEGLHLTRDKTLVTLESYLRDKRDLVLETQETLSQRHKRPYLRDTRDLVSETQETLSQRQKTSETCLTPETRYISLYLAISRYISLYLAISRYNPKKSHSRDKTITREMCGTRL